MNTQCRFVVVDDHQLFADGLVRILQDEPDFHPVAVLAHIDALWDILELNEVDLILLDIQLQGQSGLDICVHIRRQYPAVKIVLISMIQAPHISKEALRQGANGFVPKTTDAHELKGIVRQIWQGEDLFVHAELAEGDEKTTLTEREMEIVHLIKNGQSTKAIAEQLFISEYTVETHRKNILRKLGINSATELIAYAYANHL